MSNSFASIHSTIFQKNSPPAPKPRDISAPHDSRWDPFAALSLKGQIHGGIQTFLEISEDL